MRLPENMGNTERKLKKVELFNRVIVELTELKSDDLTFQHFNISTVKQLNNLSG